jgi:hypothetical protein
MMDTTRELVERRDAVNFDARPPYMRNQHHPRDMDEPEVEWKEGAEGIIPVATTNRPPILPTNKLRTQLRDFANLIANGLTYGEVMDGMCLKIESDEEAANALAAKLNKWAREYLA